MIERARKLLFKLYKAKVLELLEFTHTGVCMRAVFLDPTTVKFYVVRYDSRGMKYDVDVLEATQETKSYSILEVRELLNGQD